MRQLIVILIGYAAVQLAVWGGADVLIAIASAYLSAAAGVILSKGFHA